MVGERRAPQHVLDGIRAIDSRADLIYLGPDEWWLGVWNPSSAATRRAQKRLDRWMSAPIEKQVEAAAAIEMLHLAVKGFRPIELYEIREPDDSIVRDFAERDRLYRTAAEETFERRLETSMKPHDHEDAGQRVADALTGTAPFAFKHFMRGARRFVQSTWAPVQSSARKLIRSTR